jgi:hypothetical protein
MTTKQNIEDSVRYLAPINARGAFSLGKHSYTYELVAGLVLIWRDAQYDVFCRVELK